MNKIYALLLSAVPLLCVAQNPIIHDQFCADPTARLFGDRVYLYPSHDIPAPEGQRQDWFCMADYHVFSSANLVDWQDHGVIITQNEVPWVKPDSYSMWAPECVCKDGKYYFYFPSAPKEGRGFAIGVATASRPEGPFVCEPTAIAGVGGIDPTVLIDDDGQSYLYWSGMGIRGARLKDNMKELDGETKVMEGLPEGFKEGPHVFKRNGWYYLTFPWVRHEGGTETLAYAMSKNPLGPWDFKGIFMAEHANKCWTNHHSFLEFKGQWYLFYHHNDYSPSMDKRRSARIEKVLFNPDGTIREVKPTLRGVGICQATKRLDVDRYSAASEGVEAVLLDTVDTFRGWEVRLPKRGSWLRYADVDFSQLEQNAYIVANVKAAANTELTIRERDAKGKVIARLKVIVKPDAANAGPRPRDYSNQWFCVTAPVSYIPKGIADLAITVEGDGACIDWIQFKNRQHYFTPATGQQAKPDADGFIRRWTVLEPIEQSIRSNTVFTDTYLREAFTKSYFKEQMTMLPRDGQKVKAGKQSLAWHALDSELFNVKLFRFADLLGKQVYGVLFWAVTVIDCPDDIQDVRLAAGSNGASMWWLNGEEALLLSGDRRMVKDDGMSPRLTLKKGLNVLRCAVINGPGMSDMCARFVDENGKPITNFEIR